MIAVTMFILAAVPLTVSRTSLAQNGPLPSNNVPLSVPTYNGVVVARVEAAISPLIDGVITAIQFKPGQQVKKGDLLFRLYSDLLDAKKQVALAKLRQAEARLKNTSQLVGRYQKLVVTKAVSTLQYAEAKIDQEVAAASVAEAQANLRIAELELAQTRIVSPIDGRMSRPLMKLGDYAEAKKGVQLAIVQQLDPIQVAYQVPYRQFEIQLKRMRQSTAQLNSLKLGLMLPTGERYSQYGEVEFTDAQFDKKTGLMTVWATFPNPDMLLRPGLGVKLFNQPPQ